MSWKSVLPKTLNIFALAAKRFQKDEWMEGRMEGKMERPAERERESCFRNQRKRKRRRNGSLMISAAGTSRSSSGGDPDPKLL